MWAIRKLCDIHNIVFCIFLVYPMLLISRSDSLAVLLCKTKFDIP